MMKVINSIKKRGFIGTIQCVISKFLKIDKLQEENDTLYYFLNQMTDIKSIPPTKDPDLRKMQIGMTILLKIFDVLCEKHNLSYWLDFGTLLGAVRHRGFIPWDDDLDVAMLREDYDKLMPLIEKDLEGTGIFIRWGGIYDDMGYMARLAMGYKTAETGIWMDIFPIDHVKVETSIEKVELDLRRMLKKYQTYYKKAENRISVEQIAEKKKTYFSKFNKGNRIIYFHRPEWFMVKAENIKFMSSNSIFPLQRMEFEGVKLAVPNKPDIYLRKFYGNFYMKYPRTGVEHHTSPDGEMAKDRAKNHGVDMDIVIAHLEQILKNLDI